MDKINKHIYVVRDNIYTGTRYNGYYFTEEQIEQMTNPSDTLVYLDEEPRPKPLKEGYIQRLVYIPSKNTMEYVYIEKEPEPSDKTPLEELEDKLTKKINSMDKRINICTEVILSSSAICKDEARMLYFNGVIDRNIVLNKIKNNSLYLKDYEYITGEDFPITDFTRLELIENKVRELRDNTFKRISQGIISNISGEDLWYKYDIKDQINFLDGCNIINLSNLVDKGTMGLGEDFPLKSEVNIGDMYKITHMVADNEEGRTNTNKIFNPDDVIVWNGKDWVSISFFENIQWNAYKPNKDKEIKQEVILSINKFKSLYSEIGLKKKDFIEKCNYKIGLIEKLQGLEEIYNYDVSIPHLIDEYQKEVGVDSE